MQHITVPIPDGIDEDQQLELTAWLSMKAAEASPDHLPCEDDPTWQAEAAARIRSGMDDVKSGRVFTASQARQRLEENLGFIKAK